MARGFLEIKGDRAVYHLSKNRDYYWADPEEWVRFAVVGWLIVEKGYPPKRMDVEVLVLAARPAISPILSSLQMIAVNRHTLS